MLIQCDMKKKTPIIYHKHLCKRVKKGSGGEGQKDSGRVVNASRDFVSNLSKIVFNNCI